LSSLIRDVESAAKRLRNEVRKRANATQLQKNLQNAAGQLRKAAAQAVGQVEKYVQSVRKELEKGSGAAKPNAKTARRRPAKRRRTTRKKAKA
jgi:phosphotransferase system IIB component